MFLKYALADVSRDFVWAITTTVGTDTSEANCSSHASQDDKVGEPENHMSLIRAIVL